MSKEALSCACRDSLNSSEGRWDGIYSVTLLIQCVITLPAQRPGKANGQAAQNRWSPNELLSERLFQFIAKDVFV